MKIKIALYKIIFERERGSESFGVIKACIKGDIDVTNAV